MRIHDLHNDMPRISYGKRLSHRLSLIRPKMFNLLPLVFVGILCVGSFQYGSRYSENKIENLEKQLNGIHASLNKEAASRNLVKRDVAEIDSFSNAHHVLKRNTPDVVTKTISSNSERVTYTRWGRRGCPSTEGTSLVYKGVAATSYNAHTGGGANMLCLSLNVSYPSGSFVNGNQGSSYIYGVEYGDSSSSLLGLLDLSLIEGIYRYQNVPCAVCMATGKVNQLMIPAMGSCPGDWQEEYTGYIMSESYGNKHSGSFICVDGTPESVSGSEGNQAGSYLYMSETQCPSLQCEPFVNGRELRCAVCTI